MDTKETALYWLNKGIATIPIAYRGKRPLVKWREYQTRLPTQYEIEEWYGSSAPRNIAIITGWRNLAVLDFDNPDIYVKWQMWAATRSGVAGLIATRTYRVFTARGTHIYLRLRHPTRTRPLYDQKHKPCGIDVKCLGGYVIAPPSVHPSGAIYRSPDENAIIPSVEALSDVLPADLLTLPTNTEYNEVKMPRVKVVVPDPWEVAANPKQPSRDLIDAIRARFRIEEFFPQRWQTGEDWYLTRCPFHDDHDPSMWIDTAKQWVGCFAGCTPRNLDVINLYARLNDLGNVEAIHKLAKML